MGRRSGGGGGSRSAPRPAAPAPKPAAKPASASAPAKNSSAPAPDKKPSALAPAQSSFLGSVNDGFGFAVGMSMARSLLGGRREEPAPASPAHADADADACGIHNQDFTNCIYTNASDISRCQNYFDLLYQCRRGGGAGAGEASTIA
ncbi:hypothetical protein CFC21_063798 [Triticum aestivum]|uniref:Uncharacterized protein n=2 Tax=Triticum aestivum TaxID=4565 RepID=A0A3B6KAA6_WHEAT|nr:coiled-coil-helix-coiled-coil-helix domain-containing protein 10, mitochondrial-like [Triticum aestivum]KAF7056384.1 hypothetical protein CFC21_063798 [Triticum aestivum]